MKTFFISAFVFVPIACSMVMAQKNQTAVRTVESVDLNRYAGLWYEIAKIPNRFQRKCVAGTTAEYTLLEKGLIQVVNRCRVADGKEDLVKGVARINDATTNAQLSVSFVYFLGRNWFWGDYWIIGLDDNYQWAIVGHPKRDYGWILARKPELTPSELEDCQNILRQQGYDPDDFVATEH